MDCPKCGYSFQLKPVEPVEPKREEPGAPKTGTPTGKGQCTCRGCSGTAVGYRCLAANQADRLLDAVRGGAPADAAPEFPLVCGRPCVWHSGQETMLCRPCNNNPVLWEREPLGVGAERAERLGTVQKKRKQ